MNYTLFIDESGDFTSRQGEWVVAGLLFPDTLEQATKTLNTVFYGFADANGLTDERDFHATELRPYLSREEFHKLLATVLEKPFSSNRDCRLLAVVNTVKKKLSTAEMTYRLMLQDLLALADSSLTEEVTGIDLVIATRTINGILQTNVSDIQSSVLDNIRGAMEEGLAARGLVSSIDAQQIHVHQLNAKNHWGLRTADFLANLIFHRAEDEAAHIIARLEGAERLRTFESFGGYEQRRARIAERDGDNVSALQRWLLLEANSDAARSERKDALARLTRRIVTSPGTTAARHSVEVLIERIQRNTQHKDVHEGRYKAAMLLEQSLQESQPEGSLVGEALRFRVRNYCLLSANHMGDSVAGRRLIALQEFSLPVMSQAPEDFIKVMQFLLYRIETANNEMDFALSLQWAQEYFQLVEEFQSLLGLLPLGANRPETRPSDIWIKAATTLLRCKILAALPSDSAALEALVAEAGMLSELSDSPADRLRLLHYKIWALLKSGKNGVALELSGELNDQLPNGYNLYWMARTAVDWALTHPGQIHGSVERVLTLLRSQKPGGTKDALLHSLLCREEALLEALVGHDKKQGESLIKESYAKPQPRTITSALKLWLLQLAVLHGDHLHDRATHFPNYFEPTVSVCDQDTFWDRCRSVAEKARTDLPSERALIAARRITPL